MRRIFMMTILAGILTGVVLPHDASAARRKPSPPTKTYQVTGPVLELTADTIVVQKGKERWEIARDGSTKVTGDVKVGSTVTIQYRMTAASVEAKPTKAPAAKKPKT